LASSHFQLIKQTAVADYGMSQPVSGRRFCASF
jgi:hypothetical protein